MYPSTSSEPRTTLRQTFLYVQRAAQPEQLHRATARRIEQARMQRVAYETANAIQFGEITAQHLDVVNARRPEASPFEVPADNTTAQAMELDRQRELLQPQENAARDATQTASVKVRLGGMWVPMEVGYFVASPSNRFTGSRHFFTGYIPRVYAYTTD
ncbi:hypothetical protein GN958_ATG01334 [Phytophthora infestans]|uniref:Uncharacterized protein n=1 Tax=Phytophthora infestans TaxID=4787 RepID=A0A8S9VE83_PHYIN|nr:hypothetical protein GN958_ATG19564 [Phytophthora infestans]KAF4149519.1 hypothetical protein GN958_ATG01334 [Phytophthora infestans]